MSLRFLAALVVAGLLGGVLGAAAQEAVGADPSGGWPPAGPTGTARPADRAGTERDEGALAMEAGVLTADGTDSYALATSGASTIVSAPPSNTGGNLRVAFWWGADAPSADHESCATFRAVDHGQQPGVALRIRSGGGRTRAITVTENLWGDAHWLFNVHVMDSGAAEPVRQVGSADLAATFLLAGDQVRPYPWRMCARVDADLVRFVVWPADEVRPDWADPAHGGSATLPDGWEGPGRPGLYAGHLPPGRAVEFSSVST